jgi:hypothetical protein
VRKFGSNRLTRRERLGLVSSLGQFGQEQKMFHAVRSHKNEMNSNHNSHFDHRWNGCLSRARPDTGILTFKDRLI